MSLPFHHSVAQVVQKMLIDKGWGADPTPGASGTAPDFSVYASNEPPKPDNTITCYGTSPIIFGRAQVTGEQFEHRGVTIRVRGYDEPTANRRAELLRWQLLEQLYQHVVFLVDPVDTLTYKYLINSFSKVSLVQFGYATPTDKRFIVNLNCTSPINVRP